MDNKDKQFMIANLINGLVKDEWDAVEGYNSAIATLSDFEEFEGIISNLEDIRDEEYVHIGQLQSCLSILNGDPVEQIDDGSEEGFEKLELPEEDEPTDFEDADGLELELEEDTDLEFAPVLSKKLSPEKEKLMKQKQTMSVRSMAEEILMNDITQELANKIKKQLDRNQDLTSTRALDVTVTEIISNSRETTPEDAGWYIELSGTRSGVNFFFNNNLEVARKPSSSKSRPGNVFTNLKSFGEDFWRRWQNKWFGQTEELKKTPTIKDMDIEEVKDRLKSVGFGAEMIGKSDRELRAMLKLNRQARGTMALNKWKKERDGKKPTEESLKEDTSVSKEQMKEIICSMINKYDASEEEAFDEIQSTNPNITREEVHKLYQMCSGKTEELEESYEKISLDEMWEELDNMGE